MPPKEQICFGPLCDQLKQAAQGPGGNASVNDLIGSTISKFINMGFIVAGLLMLFFLMWGALDWILSEGDKERVSKAQKKITNAIIGMILIVLSITIFGVVTGDVLGIFVKTRDGWIMNIPSLTQP